ncbi:hypothetical protein OF83DRAFT_343283 [Amylostereum chailletii]|nr:hypothetical protein OF83DRAFT_343283 [Amylostereum chailletii]
MTCYRSVMVSDRTGRRFTNARVSMRMPLDGARWCGGHAELVVGCEELGATSMGGFRLVPFPLSLFSLHHCARNQRETSLTLCNPVYPRAWGPAGTARCGRAGHGKLLGIAVLPSIWLCARWPPRVGNWRRRPHWQHMQVQASTWEHRALHKQTGFHRARFPICRRKHLSFMGLSAESASGPGPLPHGCSTGQMRQPSPVCYTKPYEALQSAPRYDKKAD